jgi:hypothetical protein
LRGQFIDDGLTFARKLHQCLNVVELPRYLTIEFEAFFEAGALLEDFAGTLLIGPEVRLCDLLLQFVKLLLFGCTVKETSGRPRRESSIH